MHIKIHRIAKDVEGNFRACKIKIDGKKYPRKFGAWYFEENINQAKLKALAEHVLGLNFYDYLAEEHLVREMERICRGELIERGLIKKKCLF